MNKYSAPEKTRIATRRSTGFWSGSIDCRKSGEIYVNRLKQAKRSIPESPIIKFDLLLSGSRVDSLVELSFEGLFIT